MEHRDLPRRLGDPASARRRRASNSPSPRAGSPPCDRAWQLEVERHRAQGTSAAFLGAERPRLGPVRPPGPPRRHRPPLLRPPWTTRRPPPGSGRTSTASTPAGAKAPRAPEFARAGLAPGPLGALDAARRLARHAHPLRRLPRQAVARGGRPRASATDAVELFATDGPGTSGSNGWLVAGDAHRHRAPVIAGDPHRFIEDPGVYQQIHLVLPGVRRRRPRRPGRPRHRPLRPHRRGRLGHHQRHGRLPGPLPRAAAPHRTAASRRSARTALAARPPGTPRPSRWRAASPSRSR